MKINIIIGDNMKQECYQEYQEFLHYVKTTWKEFLECQEWKAEPKIDVISLDYYKGRLTVFVYLKDNMYFKYYHDGGYYGVKTDKPIKVTYSLNNELLTYMLFCGNIIKDLNIELDSDDICLNEFFDIDKVEFDEYLTDLLYQSEQSYAEAVYCAIHDL